VGGDDGLPGKSIDPESDAVLDMMDTIALADNAWAKLRWCKPNRGPEPQAWRAIVPSMKYVGLDVHKDSIAVAIAEETAAVHFYGEIPATTDALRKLVRRLGSPEALRFAYEAGPCGYGVYRTLTGLGAECVVAAPSLIPQRPGDRVKTDRRDACGLARLHRAGELTAVWVPDEGQEAMRDLTRAREDAKLAETHARQRLGSFLLRHGFRFAGRTRWSQAYFAWLTMLPMSHPMQRVALEEYRQAVEDATARVARLTAQLEHAVSTWSLAPQVQALQTLRGVSLVVASTVMAEFGSLRRFDHPKELMAYVGVVPSEETTGDRVRRGPITKTGNGHVRRVLIEASWAYRHPPRRSYAVRRREVRQPEHIKAIAWRAQLRLCGRFQRLVARGKVKQQVVTAVARELVAFMWEIDRAVTRAA
jgi:transposase